MISSSRKWPWVSVALLGAYVAWLAVGIFPVSPLEGDEQGVINGATAMSRGEANYVGLSYLPEIQPGSYALLSTASRWSGIPVETIFAVGTVIGAALFAWCAAALLVSVLHLPFWIVLAGLLWNQEIFSAAYYLNTTALGMWLTFIALLLACRLPDWRTCLGMILCLAVAGWIRIDCLLPAPAIPLLVFNACRNLRTTVRVTTFTAIGALTVVMTLYHVSGITWASLSSIYAGRGGVEGWWATVRFLPLLLSPVGCLLVLIGLVRLFLKREWKLIALVAAGCAATLPIYGTSLASTKYFYHLVPFALIPAFFAGRDFVKLVAEMRPARRTGIGLVFSLVAFVDQTFAFQTSTPEFRRYAAEPVFAELARLPGRSRPVRLVFGAGEVIPTADGFRLRGGAGFAPWIWHREKTAMRVQLSRLEAICRDSSHVTFYYSGWLPYQMAVRTLRSSGYDFAGQPIADSMSYGGDWIRGDHRIRIEYLPYRTSPFFDASRQPENRTGTQTYFIGDLSGVQPITELSDQGDWTPLSPEYLWNFMTVYRRRPGSPAP